MEEHLSIMETLRRKHGCSRSQSGLTISSPAFTSKRCNIAFLLWNNFWQVIVTPAKKTAKNNGTSFAIDARYFSAIPYRRAIIIKTNMKKGVIAKRYKRKVMYW